MRESRRLGYVSGAPGSGKTSLAVPLAADAPAVVIEANFRPYSEYERGKLAGLAARPVEVHCDCPAEVAVQRYNSRVTHAVHVVKRLKLAAMAEYDRPVGIGPLVRVGTTRPVDVVGMAKEVRRHLGA
jgi:predicted kinase